MQGTILAFYIDGMKMSAVLVRDGQRVSRRQITMRFDDAGFQECLESLTETWPSPDQIGVAVIGAVRDGCLQTLNPESIPFWRGFPLADVLSRRFSAPVTMINDAQARAWAEFTTAECEYDNFLFLNIANDVSAALVLDGKLRIGTRGLAGQIGFMPLRRTPLGDDEAYGSLESIVSGKALGRQASLTMRRYADGPSLFALAETDPNASAILDNAAAAVAEAISICRLVVDIDCVIMGGTIGVMESMIGRIEQAQEQLPKECRAPLLRATLGADAPLSGVINWVAHTTSAA